MASTEVIRVTMFKFAKKEDQQSMLEYMREMVKTAVKVYEASYCIWLSSGLVRFHVFLAEFSSCRY
jgi:hypothetical protein